MRRSPRPLAGRLPALLGLVLAAGLGLPAGAASAAASRPDVLFTVTISAIDTDGTPIASPSATVYGVNGTEYLASGHTAHVPAGTYVVAAPVWRPADDGSQTLVARQVHVTASTHVTLDAQGAVPVDAALTGAAGVTQGAQEVELCIRAGGTENSVTGYTVDPTATAYVKAMTSSHLQTVYQTYWQGAAGVYELAGAHSGGIPASPVYHQSAAGMARVHMLLPDYDNVSPLTFVIASYDGCGTTFEPIPALPADYTDYRTPGSWNVNLNFSSAPGHQTQNDLWQTRDYKGGHSYAEVWGGAAAGPGRQFPQIDGTHVVFGPNGMFDDPAVHTDNCEGRAAVTFRHGTAVVATKKLKFCGSPDLFTAHPPAPGWYTLSATANRWIPGGGTLPGTLLSTQTSLAWRFRYAPVTGHPIDDEAAPVAVTVFRPVGLDIANAAPPGTTTVKFTVLRGGGGPVPTPVYPLHSVHLQVSFNDGATWTAVGAAKSGGAWIAHVHDGSAGYVSLRTVVTDTHGDSSTETILRAYQVS